MTKLKVCGVTQVQNAAEVASEGVDAIGLNFYQHSARYVDIDTAKRIILALPPFITVVGLFVNHSQLEVSNIIDKLPLDILQFHGTESPQFCQSFGRPYIKAIAMDNTTNLPLVAKKYHSASALLLDTKSDTFGGSGRVFDWELIQDIDLPIILAGGITAHNAHLAIGQVSPYALDSASGVESGTKGIKDIAKVRALVQAIKSG